MGGHLFLCGRDGLLGVLEERVGEPGVLRLEAAQAVVAPAQVKLLRPRFHLFRRVEILFLEFLGIELDERSRIA
jgi:hypothetical protein